ncbi:hypothetical protein A9Q93_01070 [Nonlabens dokdonensis]|uniref:Glycosyl transferase family 1 domain-containing protein n=1 Tax=Nonlabens dokdonensis TaxID=328515 RepID=A0A1Z8BFS3_9FLAO|nr:glycosyltransferase family 4 protein [Nonlabens dokdonensis]OUS21424.1 hypothetical protein A9Q93_01070 [Nonlabens dokdonensis]
MRNIRIFYIAFCNEIGDEILIGGIQNYIKSLHSVTSKAGYNCNIYQYGNTTFETVIENISIHSLEYRNSNNVKKAMKFIFDKFSQGFEEDDIIIWGSDTLAIPVKFENVIAIQHGITFDLIYYNNLRGLWRKNFFGKVYKQLQCLKARKSFQIPQKIVCVDYNYQNWVRTQLPRNLSDRIQVIPNYSIPSTELNINKVDKEKIKILFARRFSFERGMEIMFEVVETILNSHDDVEFTFCGDGPYKKSLIKKFGKFNQVTITSFGIGESEVYNLSHHISLIPTYGSEGTSFSLLEAMACGTVPIASDVGGMTNIILNGFNGILCKPNAKDFVQSIEYLLENRSLLDVLSTNAYETVIGSFSYDIWGKRWIDYLKQF